MRRKPLLRWSNKELLAHVRVGYDASHFPDGEWSEGCSLKSALVFHQNRLKMPRRHVRQARREGQAEGFGFPNFLVVTFEADGMTLARTMRFDGDSASFLVGDVVSYEREDEARASASKWIGARGHEIAPADLSALVGRAFFEYMTGRRH